MGMSAILVMRPEQSLVYILLAHPWGFGSGELKMLGLKLWKTYLTSIFTFVLGAQKNLPIEMILLST